MNIITRINEVFGGDVNDKKPTHINSLCRIAYVGYLREVLGLRYKNISDVTGYTVGTIRKRLERHRGHYKFDKIYKQKFNSITQENESNSN